MKKHLWIFAAAAAALAACSNDDTIAVNQGYDDASAISFRPVVNNLTRASDVTTTNLASFYVVANIAGSPVTNYFGGTTPVEFSDANVGTGEGKHASTAGTYTSSTKYYWPSTGKLDFIAFAPNTGTDIAAVVGNDSTSFTVTPNATPSAQQDFVYAVVREQDKANNGSGVVLNFRHAESKVAIQLRNTSTDKKFTVRNVSIGNILPTGAFAPVYKTSAGSQAGFSTNGTLKSNTTIASETGYYISDAAWTASGTPCAYTQVAGTTAYAAAAGASALTNEMILIPQTLTQATAYSAAAAGSGFNGPCITVELKIQDLQNHYLAGLAAETSEGANDDYVIAMWPLSSITWLPGHKYTYTVDLAGGGYKPTNDTSIGEEGSTTLDPILDNAEIKFVNVTVDVWGDGAETSVYTTGL